MSWFDHSNAELGKTHGEMSWSSVLWPSSSLLRCDISGWKVPGRLESDWENLTFSSHQVWTRGEFFTSRKASGGVFLGPGARTQVRRWRSVRGSILPLSCFGTAPPSLLCSLTEVRVAFSSWRRILDTWRWPVFSVEYLEVAQGHSSLQAAPRKEIKRS